MREVICFTWGVISFSWGVIWSIWRVSLLAVEGTRTTNGFWPRVRFIAKVPVWFVGRGFVMLSGLLEMGYQKVRDL
jgi:hypothetical protein